MNVMQEGSFEKRQGRENLLKNLKAAQREYGYISQEFIKEAAQTFDFTISEVYGITTFYSFLSTRPLGKYVIRICRSVPCYLQNAEMIIEVVANEIGIIPGQTTDDRKFSFELTNCIGACDFAPAMLINDEVYGHLTSGKIADLLMSFE